MEIADPIAVFRDQEDSPIWRRFDAHVVISHAANAYLISQTKIYDLFWAPVTLRGPIIVVAESDLLGDLIRPGQANLVASEVNDGGHLLSSCGSTRGKHKTRRIPGLMIG